jgi:ADP-L-glycero-D-manno-heptose 6-epimerase
VISPLPLLVTGAAGFVGARLVEKCNQRGIPVISVDKAGHFNTRAEHQGIDYGKIIDREELFTWLAHEKPSLRGVAHLGACTDTTELDEAYLRRVNIEYSQALWEFASSQKIPFVYASSAATYGNGENGYADDEAAISELRPLNPYGESKRLFDLWALGEETKGSHPPAWSGLKFFNVYGFGERHKESMSSLVVKAFDEITATGKLKLFRSHKPGIGDGEQKRDFVYVEDVVQVIFFCLEKPIARGIFNLGTGEAKSFLKLARAVFHAMGRPEEIEFIDTPPAIRERYQYFTEAKMDRLRNEGYLAKFLGIEEGAMRTVADLKRFSSQP